jgi:hypothetical protein
VIEPRLFVCSGAKVAGGDPVAKGRHRVELNAIGSDANVYIRFENLTKVFCHDLSPRLLDFLEIASYVFSADCATPRGKKWTDDQSTEPWSRNFAFVIPVREPAFWGTEKIQNLLEEVLGFLSNDKYSFTFVPLEHDRAAPPPYFEFDDLNEWPFHRPERVIMFSGGLDSLAGAVEAAASGDRVVLASHRPVTTLDSRQKRLFAELQRQFPNQLAHIPVWINKAERLGREPTQRTRSFLYSALGTLVAQSAQAGGVRFYENGVVSLNLPLAEEALRARASRTTHPVTLHLLSSLSAAVTERNLVVDNPYLFSTKTEVVESLATHHAAHLIALTCSCSHSMFQSKNQRHCGRCSQCTDRRFATTAAGLLAYDSEKDYVSDVFIGPRKSPVERAIATDYTRHGIELHLRSESELAAIFNAELSRAVRYDAKRSEAAQKIMAMHKRHGDIVVRVLEQRVRENAAKLIRGQLDDTSLLALTIGKYRRQQCDSVEVGVDGPDNSVSSVEIGKRLTNLDETMKTILAKFGNLPTGAGRKKKKATPGKRDTILFAAILLGLKGMKYCSFLQGHGLKPKWSDDPSLSTYLRGYQVGDPFRKKIQDEKARAKVRMTAFADSELADSLIFHLPAEFEELSASLSSRNSRGASKNSTAPKLHKH